MFFVKLLMGNVGILECVMLDVLHDNITNIITALPPERTLLSSKSRCCEDASHDLTGYSSTSASWTGTLSQISPPSSWTDTLSQISSSVSWTTSDGIISERETDCQERGRPSDIRMEWIVKDPRNVHIIFYRVVITIYPPDIPTIFPVRCFIKNL